MSKSVSGSFRSNHMPLNKIFRFEFGYDNSIDTYKAVMVRFLTDGGTGGQVRNTVQVFTLGDNIWRDIQSFPMEVVFHSRGRSDEYAGVYLRNSICWLVCHQNNLIIKQFVIISLDLAKETNTQLLLPKCCDEFPLDNQTLCVDGLYLFFS